MPTVPKPLKIKETMAGVARACETLVGSQLSEVGAPPNNLPSVFLARSTPPKPKHPYLVIDFVTAGGVGQSHRASYVDDEDKVVKEFDREVSLLATVYDSVSGDSASICEDLRTKLLTEAGLQALLDETEYKLLDVGDVTFSGNFLKSDFEEASRISIDLSALIVEVGVAGTVIESTAVDGTLTHPDGTTLDADASAP